MKEKWSNEAIIVHLIVEGQAERWGSLRKKWLSDFTVTSLHLYLSLFLPESNLIRITESISSILILF
ncbi:hypothetical protein ACH3XW_47860 [Acanthocheilonema viteae]